ncbi:type III pantothenate kinase [Polaribacter sargassicola]|uniref:type III pantothenate kinase n=1 Tax=Polaribacter sargassicola TaxID=2836891 RepID=UPI001F43BC23|nr:type III pantothenate kinase [Polaribacter sp. DS7-9]MCG1035973.1 type III pantothenate kinase [Polaribacter sp. DS7-9]
MNLIIDIGNTRIKVAVFEKDSLLEVVVCDKKNILLEVKNILKKYSISNGIMSNVATISENQLKELQNLIPIKIISSSTKLPFKNLYKTPKTLGVDRIALIMAAVNKYNNNNVLIIDAGTCITFDFINKEREYLGGAISPGINMRFNALNHFTAKLPLLEKEEVSNFIGNSTKDCMNSGVVNGVIQEIDGVINQYKKKYSQLKIVLTGGDTKFLLKQLKSSIFADQNFLLNGLNEILNYSLKK